MNGDGRLGEHDGQVFHPTAIELVGVLDACDGGIGFLGRAAEVVEHVKHCIDCRAQLLVARVTTEPTPRPCRHCDTPVTPGPTGGWMGPDGWTVCQKNLPHEPLGRI